MNLCLHEFEVKGILDGTITELWRPVKPQPRETSEWLDVDPRCNFEWKSCYCGINYIKSKSPFGPVGTRITGRETHWRYGYVSRWVGSEPIEPYFYMIPYYEGQGVGSHLVRFDDPGKQKELTWVKLSSTMMPSWASRIILINTGVECKRAREIAEEEARAAGSQYTGGDGFSFGYTMFADIQDDYYVHDTAKEAFKECWNFLYAKKGYPFESAYAWKLKFEAEVKR
jgi:hypothetical protein